MRADLIAKLRQRAHCWRRNDDKARLSVPLGEIRAVLDALSAAAEPEPVAAISIQDPMVIIAGIKQFGLAPDGSDIRDLVAVVQALSSKEGRSTDAWQTIDSAPHDGTNIILWTTTADDNELTAYLDATGGEGDPKEIVGAQIGYWNSDLREWTLNVIGNPTHWQPLPPPPNGESREAGDERQVSDR